MKSGAGLKYKVHTQCGRTGLEEHQIRPARLSSLCLRTSQLKRSKSVHVKACNYALLYTEHDMIFIISPTWLRPWGVRLTFVYCVRVSHASTAAVYFLNLVHSLPFSSFYLTILNSVQLSTLIEKCSIEHFPIKVLMIWSQTALLHMILWQWPDFLNTVLWPIFSLDICLTVKF